MISQPSAPATLSHALVLDLFSAYLRKFENEHDIGNSP